MEPGSDPRRRLIFSDRKYAVGHLNSGDGTPSRDEGARERGVEKALRTPRTPEGVIAQPSAPQFSSSQAVISE
jgi:hypothetical protein